MRRNFGVEGDLRSERCVGTALSWRVDWRKYAQSEQLARPSLTHHTTFKLQVLMFLSASSIVWDSQRSNQNKVVAQWIRHGALSEGASLIGLDHVCSDGRQVSHAYV